MSELSLRRIRHPMLAWLSRRFAPLKHRMRDLKPCWWSLTQCIPHARLIKGNVRSISRFLAWVKMVILPAYFHGNPQYPGLAMMWMALSQLTRLDLHRFHEFP